MAVTPRGVRLPGTCFSSLNSAVTQQHRGMGTGITGRDTGENRLPFQHFIAIIQVFPAVYKCFIFMGPLQVCLNNVASTRRPPHATCLTLGTWEGGAHTQEQGPGYTIHFWKSYDICKLTQHPSKSGYPESQSLPQRPRYTNVHTLKNKTKKSKSTLCHPYALACVGVQ